MFAGGGRTVEKAGLDSKEIKGNTGLIKVVGLAINAVLALLGVFFIALTVYGGTLWMTARGENEQVTKAREIIRNALSGLIVVVSAYAISYFILSVVFSLATREDATGFPIQ